MKKLLFISNIADEKIGSFSLACIHAATGKFDFHQAANFSAMTPEQKTLDEQQHGITIHQIDFQRNPLHPGNRKAYRQLVDLMRREQFDVVHCNTPTGGVYGRLAAKRCGVGKVIYQAHGFHFYHGAPLLNWLIYYPVERLLAHITDKLITINTEDYAVGQRFHLRNAGKTYYVPGVGVDLAAYTGVRHEREIQRQALGLTDSDFAVLCAGRLEENKNVNTLIHAVADVHNQHCHLLICGDGEQKTALGALADSLGIAAQIHFLGKRSDMPELYQASDAFALASEREGLSRAIMEAMASGLPCVVSRIRGNSDLIADGVNGFLCECRDSGAYARAFMQLDENRQLGKAMGRENQSKVRRFSLQAVEEAQRAIYEELL